MRKNLLWLTFLGVLGQGLLNPLFFSFNESEEEEEMRSFLVSQEVENNKEVGTSLKNMPLVTLLF